MNRILISFKNGFKKYAPKAVGAAALSLVGYDAHVIGKMQADVYSKSKDADAMARAYNNTLELAGSSQSTAYLKNEVLKLESDNNMRHFVNSVLGYFKGFGSMLIDNIFPLGLGLAALTGKNRISKYSAAGLGIYAIIKFFKDVVGLGNSNDLNRKF